MSPARRFVTAVAVTFATATSLAAQSATQATSGDPPSAVANADQAPAASADAAAPRQASLAPTEENARAGVRALSPGGPTPAAPPRRDPVNKNVALMIVGGAVLIVGALVGGTAGGIIMIGGGAIGIIGLYRYLQ